MIKISCIIPTMKGREAMLQKLLSTLPEDCEKIVVNDEDLLLAAKRNKGARQAKGEYLFFVDDDNYLKDFSLCKMLEYFGETIGVMGMTACYDDKKMIIADGGSRRNYLTGFTEGVRTNAKVYEGVLGDLYAVDEVANAFMIRRDIFEATGGFDEKNFPIDLDEADLCKRIKDMGYRIVMNPHAICYHKSITYSALPGFRRKLNAYTLPCHKLRYQGKYLNALSYWMFVVFFLPLHVGLYTAALVWRRQFQMIIPYMRGTFDGLFGCRKNPYLQKR